MPPRNGVPVPRRISLPETGEISSLSQPSVASPCGLPRCSELRDCGLSEFRSGERRFDECRRWIQGREVKGIERWSRLRYAVTGIYCPHHSAELTCSKSVKKCVKSIWPSSSALCASHVALAGLECLAAWLSRDSLARTMGDAVFHVWGCPHPQGAWNGSSAKIAGLESGPAGIVWAWRQTVLRFHVGDGQEPGHLRRASPPCRAPLCSPYSVCT